MATLEEQHGKPAEALHSEPLHNRVRRVHQRATALMGDALSEFGLTPPQWAALAAVHAHGRMSQIDLGRRVAMDPATIQGVVVRLISRGFVSRSTDPHDRRCNLVDLTEEGRALIDAAGPAMGAAEATFVGPLTAREREVLAALLARLAG